MSDDELMALLDAGVLEPHAELAYVGPPLPKPEHEWITDHVQSPA